MAVTLVKSILSACVIFTSIIENPSVYAGCVFKIRCIFAPSFNGIDTDKLKSRLGVTYTKYSPHVLMRYQN